MSEVCSALEKGAKLIGFLSLNSFFFNPMTSKNSALLLSASKSCNKGRWVAGIFIGANFFTVVVRIWLWQTGPEDKLMLLRFLQRWHRGPVKTVPGCFSFPSHQLPTYECCCQLCSPQHLAEVGDFFSSIPPRRFPFFSADGICPTLADTKEPREHVHYKPNCLERFLIFLQEEAVIHVSSVKKKHHIHI